MPNHVTTRCIVTGPPDEVARFKSTMILTKTDETNEPFRHFDFNVAIPMPAALDGVEASSTSECAAILICLRDNIPISSAIGNIYDAEMNSIRQKSGLSADASDIEAAEAYLAKHPDIEHQGRLRLNAIRETGHSDWYSWSSAHWGTKWNSYSFEFVSQQEPLEFKFETAWNFPHPVFEKIAEMFPSLHFECFSYDEGGGFACEGFFNPPDGGNKFVTYSNFEIPDDLYFKVYGENPSNFEEEDEE